MSDRTAIALVTVALAGLSSWSLAARPLSDFRGMDADRDGKVSREEHAAASKRMFAAMDADRDGRVTAAEMDAAHPRVTGKEAQKGDMTSADKIKAVDKDGDGVLTAAEHEQGSRTMFDVMDANKDGALTETEMAAGHAKLMKPEAAAPAR